MADNIFQQAIGAAPTVTTDIQAVQSAADPLIARFKSIAAAAAAASLTHPELTTDEARVTWSVDQCWHNMRSVIGFGVDILRKTDANRLVTQYVAQIIAADELAAGLQALALTAAQLTPAPPAPNSPPPQMGTITVTGPPAPGVTINAGHYGPIHDAAAPPASTEAVIVPPPEHDAPSEPAAPQTFAQ